MHKAVDCHTKVMGVSDATYVFVLYFLSVSPLLSNGNINQAVPWRLRVIRVWRRPNVMSFLFILPICSV